MNVLHSCVAVVSVLTLAAAPAVADGGAGKPYACGETCCGTCQPTYLCCRAEPKTVKVRKHCYEVECEYVCIPSVSLPICLLFGRNNCRETNGCDSTCTGRRNDGCESGSQRRGGLGLPRRLCSIFTDCRIRKVRKLKKKEYEVEDCVCEWSVVCVQPTGCGKSCHNECGAPETVCAPCAE